MTVDGVVANVGSANLNGRSAACDEEINVVVIDPDVVRIARRATSTTTSSAASRSNRGAGRPDR